MNNKQLSYLVQNPSQTRIELQIDNSILIDNVKLKELKDYLEANQQIITMHLALNGLINEDIILGIAFMQNVAKLHLEIKKAIIKGDLLLQIINYTSNPNTLKSISIEFIDSYIVQFSQNKSHNQPFSMFSQLIEVGILCQNSYFDAFTFKQIVNTLTVSPNIRILDINYMNSNDQNNQFILNDQSYDVIPDPNTDCEFFEDTKASINQLSLDFFQQNNNFSQNVFKLTQNFQYLPQLQILKLSIAYYRVQLDSYKLIFLNISLLQQLTQIDLFTQNSNISSIIIELILQSLSSLINLESIKIDMSENSILGDGFKDSELLFTKCKNLKRFQLILSDCVEEVQLQNLAKSLQIAQNLHFFYLDIANLQIQDEFALQLGESIQKLASLNELRLIFSKNQITDKGIFGISQAIEQLNQLEQISISLNNNYITETGYLHLKNSLQKNIKLKNIDQDFQWHKDGLNIENNFAEILVSENNSIRNLELNLRVFDQLSQNIVDQIQRSIQQQKNVETLIIDVGKEFFTMGSSKKPLPVHDLKQLKRLIIFSDLVQFPKTEMRQVKKYIVRNSLRLIELIITDYN
ncbi:hypothetical protein ABPG74_010779 [Tetrahymena malaccensis]